MTMQKMPVEHTVLIRFFNLLRFRVEHGKTKARTPFLPCSRSVLSTLHATLINETTAVFSVN